MQSLTAPSIKITPRVNVAQRKKFSEFIKNVKKNKISEVVVRPNHNDIIYIDDSEELNVTEYVPSNRLWEVLIDSSTDYTIENTSDLDFGYALGMFINIFFLFSILRMIRNRNIPNMMSENNIFNVENNINTRFDDVQGIDSSKNELEEIVNFLKDPAKYNEIGAEVPKGAILYGKPGTGKTLLARAIAGESSVPFIQCSGSSFVEMFVGLGAKRVRDLFDIAKRHSPCILFIDEIDAIGKKRSNGFSMNDEREQTINQLLTEMDGFDDTSQVIVIAATNRVDILDEALLRPGRFDRKIKVNLPDLKGREKIIDVHLKGKKFSNDLKIRDIASKTLGFTGADIKNLINEAAILAVSLNQNEITNYVVDETFQKIVVGSRMDTYISQETRMRIARHEAGHAIVGCACKDYDKLTMVSIIPRGDAGGVTFFQPRGDDVEMFTKHYLLSRVKVALGGFVAEEIFYGAENVSTGASSDLQQVSVLVKDMVCKYGFGKYGKLAKNDDMSEYMKYVIDQEIKSIVNDCYYEVKTMLCNRRSMLDDVTDMLMKDEVIEGKLIYDLIT